MISFNVNIIFSQKVCVIWLDHHRWKWDASPVGAKSGVRPRCSCSCKKEGATFSPSWRKPQMGSETSVPSPGSGRQEQGLRDSPYSSASSLLSPQEGLNRPLHSTQPGGGTPPARLPTGLRPSLGFACKGCGSAGPWPPKAATRQSWHLRIVLGLLVFPWRSQVRRRGPETTCYRN